MGLGHGCSIYHGHAHFQKGGSRGLILRIRIRIKYSMCGTVKKETVQQLEPDLISYHKGKIIIGV